tara:strand:- start:172 stop:462 length:291 start_codon:yes stop_codon:yes gene_type:complete
MIEIDTPIQPPRPVRLPHPADFLSPKTFEKIKDAINNQINYEYSCTLEAEGRHSESIKDFDAGWLQENLEDEFHEACSLAVWQVCMAFVAKGERQL